MPIYVFECEKCEHIVEQQHSVHTIPDQVKCEQCGDTDSAKRIPARPAVIRSKFDKNGRVGYKIDMGTGKQLYRSASREKYEHQIGNMGSKAVKEGAANTAPSVHTRAYREAKEKALEKRKAKYVKEYLKKSGD